MKNKINELLKSGAFNNVSGFGKLLMDPNLKKRYSIMRVDYPYPTGANEYKSTCCFFFYSLGFLIETFYCEITGFGREMSNTKINCYSYPCNDINRSSDWEWLDIN